MFRLQGMQTQRHPGPVARILISLLVILGIAVMLFFGVIIIAIVIGMASILFIVLYVRVWWIRHKLGLQVHPRHHQDRKGGMTIEGEYTVEETDKGKQDHDA